MNQIPLYASAVSIIVQALKALIQDRLPDEVYPVFALILGVGLAVAMKLSVVEGINIGLASMGIYAVAKHAALGVNKMFPN